MLIDVRRLVPVLWVLSSFGCDRDPQPPEPIPAPDPGLASESASPGAPDRPAADVDPASAPERTAGVEIQAKPSAPPGPVYWVLPIDGLVVQLGVDGAFSELRLPHDWAKAVRLDTTGQAHALGSFGVFRLGDDGPVLRLDPPEPLGTAWFGPGEMVYSHLDELVQFRGAEEVARWSRAELGFKHLALTDTSSRSPVIVDAYGRPWLLDEHRRLHRIEFGASKTIDLGAEVQTDESIAGLVAGADAVYLAAGWGAKIGIVRVGAEDQITRTRPPGSLCHGEPELASTPTGKLVLVTNTAAAWRSGCHVRVFEPGAAEVEWEATIPGCEELATFTVDANERVWLASAAGLQVVEPGGVVAHTWPVGTQATRAGIRHLVVVGGGPASLQPDPAPISNMLKAKLLHKGRSLRDVEVELCPAIEGDPPSCTASAHRISTRTDGEGRIRVDVPAAKWHIAARYRDSWVVSNPGATAVLGRDLRAGPVQLGVLELE